MPRAGHPQCWVGGYHNGLGPLPLRGRIPPLCSLLVTAPSCSLTFIKGPPWWCPVLTCRNPGTASPTLQLYVETPKGSLACIPLSPLVPTVPTLAPLPSPLRAGSSSKPGPPGSPPEPPWPWLLSLHAGPLCQGCLCICFPSASVSSLQKGIVSWFPGIKKVTGE